MDVIWGVIVLVISLIGWLGQAITAFSPELAARWGVTEPEDDVDSTFYADVHGEAYWDTLTIWTLPVAGLLLILNSSAWPYFGLVGGGMYLYFAGRGMVVRWIMQRRAIRIGKPETLKTIYVFLTVWGLVGVITIAMAAGDLRSP